MSLVCTTKGFFRADSKVLKYDDDVKQTLTIDWLVYPTKLPQGSYKVSHQWGLREGDFCNI
jgi:hypothetical protein